MTIILYDIKSTVGAFAPNPWKIRLSLNYKNIPYKTEWIEFPDIAPTLKKLGAAPTNTKGDGGPSYTLPVIFDPKTGRYISESWAIAEYLDATYPDTPRLFPPGARGAIALLEREVLRTYAAPLGPTVILREHAVATPRGQAYLRAVYEPLLGKPFEELAPPGPVRDAQWATLRAALTVLAGFYDKNGKNKLFFFGDTFSYADAIVTAFLLFPKKVLEAYEWEEIASWDDRRWGKLVETTRTYQAQP